MAYLRISEVRATGQTVLSSLRKSADQILAEDAKTFSTRKTYDIFLSHSYKDGEIILGVKKLIENTGLTVYVDWIEDAKLDRSKVTSKTAALLRERMRVCSSLIYVHSANSPNSAWMPWELGYFDGYKHAHVWILPLVTSNDSEFSRQEYLGLYPTVDKLGSIAGRPTFGFENVDEDVGRHTVTLEKAIRGSGILFV
jgi:hypothetical protein